MGDLVGIFLGVLVILLGLKGFSSKGLALTRSRNVTGVPAMVLGGAIICVGVGFICISCYGILLQLTQR